MLNLEKIHFILAISLILCGSGAWADSAPATAPAAQKTYSLDTPEGQAIHRRIMQGQMNQQQFAVQQDKAAKVDERSRMQNEINGIDEKLAHDLRLKASEKKELQARRESLVKQIQAADQGSKKSDTVTK